MHVCVEHFNHNVVSFPLETLIEVFSQKTRDLLQSLEGNVERLQNGVLKWRESFGCVLAASCGAPGGLFCYKVIKALASPNNVNRQILKKKKVTQMYRFEITCMLTICSTGYLPKHATTYLTLSNSWNTTHHHCF